MSRSDWKMVALLVGWLPGCGATGTFVAHRPPSDAGSSRREAEAFLDSGRPLAAASRLRTDSASDAALLRAVALARSDREAEALATVDELLKTRPDESEALALRGILLRRAGRNAEALRVLERAWASSPPSIAAGAELADLHRSRGESRRAADILEVCLIHRPEADPLRERLADDLEASGRIDESIEQWHALLQRGSAGAVAHDRLARLYEVADEPDLAAAHRVAKQRILGGAAHEPAPFAAAEAAPKRHPAAEFPPINAVR